MGASCQTTAGKHARWLLLLLPVLGLLTLIVCPAGVVYKHVAQVKSSTTNVVLQALDDAEQAVEHCSTSDKAPVVVYVSKMVAVPAAALPRSATLWPKSCLVVDSCVFMR